MTDRSLTHGFSVRAVVREAAGDYVSRFWLLLVAALAVFIPAGLIEAAIHELLHWIGEDDSPGAITAAVGGALTTTVTATLGDVFYTGVVAAIVAEARGGVRHGLADIARTLPYWRLLAVDLLFALFVGVGILLLIVPGLILFTWYALAAPVVEIERVGVRAAFRRSHQLVRGNFWKVLALLFPVLLVGDFLADLLASAAHGLLGEGFAGEWLGSVLAETATAPLFALAAVVATHHLIVLHRGDPAAQPGR